MKTTSEMRAEMARAASAYKELEGVRWLLDDFEEVARELEGARDRLQVLELEVGALRRQLAGGPP